MAAENKPPPSYESIYGQPPGSTDQGYHTPEYSSRQCKRYILVILKFYVSLKWLKF